MLRGSSFTVIDMVITYYDISFLCPADSLPKVEVYNRSLGCRLMMNDTNRRITYCLDCEIVFLPKLDRYALGRLQDFRPSLPR